MNKIRLDIYEPGRSERDDKLVAACRIEYDVEGKEHVYICPETVHGEVVVAFLDDSGHGLMLVDANVDDFIKKASWSAARDAAIPPPPPGSSSAEYEAYRNKRILFMDDYEAQHGVVPEHPGMDEWEILDDEDDKPFWDQKFKPGIKYLTVDTTSTLY